MTRRRRSEGPALAILLVVGIAVFLSVVGWLWLRSRETPAPTTAPPTAFEEEPTELDPGPETLDLPELGSSDDFIRSLVAGVSAYPELASWLVTDELVRRFVGVVVDLAGGLSPRSRLEFLIPEEEFEVLEIGEITVIDPEGYRRYDLLTETFVSLDTQGAAQIYHHLYPLLDETYAELGIPDQSFDDAVTLAIGNLLTVEVPEVPLELQPNEAIYEFRDLGLEMRSPAEKHLIRMGPENARQFQAKLSELRDAIEG